MWKKKALTFTAAALMLSGCSLISPSTPAPQPHATTYTVSVETAVNLLDVIWTSWTVEERQLACMSYLSDPAAAWAAFNSGAKDAIPHSAFVYFFESHC